MDQKKKFDRADFFLRALLTRNFILKFCVGWKIKKMTIFVTLNGIFAILNFKLKFLDTTGLKKKSARLNFFFLSIKQNPQRIFADMPYTRRR